MKLSQILKRENNNLDIIRIYAALMVIFGHAHAFLPSPSPDLVFNILKFDYSGSLAVKIFFFLSGLVVTNSFLYKKSTRHFIISRVFRIWPALILVLIVTTFIVGPIVSSLTLSKYFESTQIWSYFFQNMILNIQYVLPGVFTDQNHPVMNGSLWTIPYEVFAYILLLVLFTLFNFNKILITAICSVIIIDPLIGNKILFTWIPSDNLEHSLVAPCFALGVLFSLYQEKILITTETIFLLFALFLLFKDSNYNFYFFYLFLFTAILKISSTKLLIKMKLKADPSYGIYLWGWPIQKTLIYLLPILTIGYHQIIASIIAILSGYLSWVLIEKKFINIGKKLS